MRSTFSVLFSMEPDLLKSLKLVNSLAGKNLDVEISELFRFGEENCLILQLKLT